MPDVLNILRPHNGHGRKELALFWAVLRFPEPNKTKTLRVTGNRQVLFLSLVLNLLWEPLDTILVRGGMPTTFEGSQTPY